MTRPSSGGPLSVLLVSSKYPPEYAGSGLRAHRTYQRLQKRYGIQVRVLANSVETRSSRRYELEGVEVHRISSRVPLPHRGGMLRKVAEVASGPGEWTATERLLSRLDGSFDLVHTFGNSWSVGAATRFAARRGLPLVRELCNEMPDPYYPKQLRPLMVDALDREEAIMVAISPRLERMARAKGFERVWLKPNPVERSRFHPRPGARDELRRRLTRFGPDDVVIVYVANYIPRKNHRFLVRVLEKLPDRYKLLLGGPLRDEMRPVWDELTAEIRRLRLEDRVQAQHGFVSEMADWILAGDVFGFPTTAEGLGTPLLEAQACARAVVASRITGIMDAFVEEGRGGYVADLDETRWAEAIEAAAAISPDVLNRNAEVVSARYSDERVDEAYLSILGQLASGGRVVTWPGF